MGLTTINWLSGVSGVAAFATILVVRLMQKSKAVEAHIGWAIMGALGLGAAVKSLYPLYRFSRYGNLENIEDLWLYVLVGSMAAFVVGLAAVAKAYKAT